MPLPRASAAPPQWLATPPVTISRPFSEISLKAPYSGNDVAASVLRHRPPGVLGDDRIAPRHGPICVHRIPNASFSSAVISLHPRTSAHDLTKMPLVLIRPAPRSRRIPAARDRQRRVAAAEAAHRDNCYLYELRTATAEEGARRGTMVPVRSRRVGWQGPRSSRQLDRHLLD